MRSEHVGNFLDFSNSLPAAIVRQFYHLVRQWEAGTSETNPYEAKVEGMFRFVPTRHSGLTGCYSNLCKEN